jgi:O-antigen/teichoic acid export membrane protein
VRRRGEAAAGRGSGILANTLYGLAAQGITAGFTTVLTLYLVRTLGPRGFGLFSLALSFGAILVMVADFGLASSMGRFVAERVDDRVAARRVVDSALRLKLVGAFGLGMVLALAAPLIAGALSKPDLADPLRFAGASLFFESILMLYTSAFGALWLVRYNALTILLESVTEVTASIALVAVGAGVTGAMAGRTIGYGAGVLFGAILLARLVGRPRLRLASSDREYDRRITAYAKPLLLINGAYTLYVYLDALLIGVLLTSGDVGEFTAPLRLVLFVGYIGLSVGGAVSPRLAGDRPDANAFTAALRFLVILQMLVVVPMVAWGEPIVALLLGPGYKTAGEVLRALAPYALLYGVGPLVTMTVTYLGGAGRRVPIVLLALAVNLVLDLALLPTIGVLGATIGTGVAFAIYVPAHLRIAVMQLGVDLRPLVWTLLRTLTAGAVAAGSLIALGTGRHLDAWRWVAGALLAPAVYLGSLVVLRELTLTELRSLRALVPRRSLR